MFLDKVDTEFFKFISHTLNCHNTLFVTIVCSGVATIQFQIETVSLLLDAPEVIGDVCEVLGEFLYLFLPYNCCNCCLCCETGGPCTHHSIATQFLIEYKELKLKKKTESSSNQ